MKRLIAMLLVLLFALPAMAQASADPEQITEVTGRTFEGSGYDTPEDAVLAYLDGLNQGDVTAMLSTFAYESYVAHVNPDYYVQRLKAFRIDSIACLPLTDDFSRSLMLNARYGEITDQLRYLYVVSATNYDGNITVIRDAEAYRELMSQFENSPMSSWIGNVDFVEWLEPAALDELYSNSINIANIGWDAAVCGAEDMAILAAHIRLNGEDAIQTMSCVRYDGRWFNLSLSNRLSIVLNMSDYSAGLIYTAHNGEDGQSDEPDPQSLLAAYDVTSVDSESGALLSSLQNSDLGGTSWQLTSTNEAALTVLDTKEGIRDMSDPAVYGQLHFMSCGAAYLGLRVSQALSGNEVYDAGFYAMAWSDQNGTPVINGGYIAEYAQFTRNGDELVLSSEDGTTMTFSKVGN